VHPVLKVFVTVATVAYPLLVYFGFGRWHPAWLGVALAALLFLRAWSGRDPAWLAAGVGALLLAAASGFDGSWLPVKLYPVMVSVVLLGVFGASLWRGPTIVERIARLHEPQLPAAAVAYTRKVTIAWCAFFLANGGLSAATALWASEQVWVLYNGLLAYVLIGAFFAAEWLLRQRMRARLAAAGQHG
jgi:uncharacterized membrane protein